MKTILWKKGTLMPLMLLLAACDDFAGEAPSAQSGQLRWALDHTILATKATEEVPDTNDFILTVRDAGGATLYKGPYGDSPEVLDVPEGYYTVGIVSDAFSKPAFSKPQYGDEQVVRVPAGQCVTVKLKCTLQNAGIRLRTGQDFLEAYPDGILYVKQADAKLKYLYRETRIAYVKPGDVSVLLYRDSSSDFETLFTRSIEAREILTVSISAPKGSGNGKSSITVQTDTSRSWVSENFTIGQGGDQGGGTLSVGEAASHIGEKGVWVAGYIVGGDLTSAGKTVKTEGITKNTHLALAERSSITDKASCLAVELPAGKVRQALNLVDHPELIGKRVKVKGDLVDKYFGTVGLKSTASYEMP